MEIRSRIAAETAAVVPFHCIICFEEFDLQERLPVVLPCGHTFLCGPCSKRLKRCMECREPLFYTIPKNINNSNHHNKGQSSSSSSSSSLPMTCSQQQSHQQTQPNRTTNRGGGAAPAVVGVNHHNGNTSSSGRYSPQAPMTPPHHTNSASPPHPSTVTKVLFPIPKNLVLIAMMEAARSALKPNLLDRDISDQVPFPDDSSLNQNDGEEFTLKRILTGVATLSGSCGTFVVKAKEGLSILPSIPDIQDDPPAANDKRVVADLDIGYDHTTIQEERYSSSLSSSLASTTFGIINQPLRLKQGQTVQVVTFENGYAKLARGMGFVKAEYDELVKVGAPLDQSCQLEGQLETLGLQSENLEKELRRIQELQHVLRSEVRRLQSLPPTNPVITEASVVVAESDATVDPESTKENKEHDSLLGTPTGVTSTGVHDDAVLSRRRQKQQTLLGSSDSPNDDLLVFPFDGLRLPESALPTYRRSNSNDGTMGFGCNAFLGEGAELFGMMSFSESNNNQNILQAAASTEDRPSRRYGGGGGTTTGSDDYHAYVPTLSTSSFDSVDFRTGMSCHRGLLRTNHRLSPTPRGRTGIRYMMSEHRGIAGISHHASSSTSAANAAALRHHLHPTESR